MARAMELFFYLLDCGRPMRKEQILTALWPEMDEQTEHTLHSTIYYVRKTLGDSCVVSQKGSYALNLAARYGDQVEYDVATFQNAYTQAKQALAQDKPAVARTALLTMIELYHGDYVEPFYSEWCRFRRDELRQAYLDARGQLAQLAWANSQFEESAQHWQQMLAVDMCQEEAHYGLMRCYLRQGKRGMALRQYQRCRDTLQQELNMPPGPAIQHLYQRLMTSSAR
jgi:two-component SAPR family response regulator